MWMRSPKPRPKLGPVPAAAVSPPSSPTSSPTASPTASRQSARVAPTAGCPPPRSAADAGAQVGGIRAVLQPERQPRGIRQRRFQDASDPLVADPSQHHPPLPSLQRQLGRLLRAATMQPAEEVRRHGADNRATVPIAAAFSQCVATQCNVAMVPCRTGSSHPGGVAHNSTTAIPATSRFPSGQATCLAGLLRVRHPVCGRRFSYERSLHLVWWRW